MKKLAVALDFDHPTQALDLVTKLSGIKLAVDASYCPLVFKIGLELFIQGGAPFVRDLKQSGHEIFLDLKLHDIPQTVQRSLARIGVLGVDYTTVHLSAGVNALHLSESFRTEFPQLKILGVSVLTSFSSDEWATISAGRLIEPTVHDWVRHIAIPAGLHGVVCSPHELNGLRPIFPGILVTPGIRWDTATPDDQKRTLTPVQAFQQGSDMIVIGRPITQSADPVGTVLNLYSTLKATYV